MNRHPGGEPQLTKEIGSSRIIQTQGLIACKCLLYNYMNLPFHSLQGFQVKPLLDGSASLDRT